MSTVLFPHLSKTKFLSFRITGGMDLSYKAGHYHCGCQCKVQVWQFTPVVELLSFMFHPTPIKITEYQTFAVHCISSPFLFLVSRLPAAFQILKMETLEVLTAIAHSFATHFTLCSCDFYLLGCMMLNACNICNITHGRLFLQAASRPQQYSDLIGCQA
jgi:hypothetical protein